MEILKSLNYRFYLLFAFGLAASLCSLGARAQTANLSATLTDSPDPVVVGGNLTYTYTIVNNGPSTASSIVLSNRLASTVIFNSATATNGSWMLTNGVFYAFFSNVVQTTSLKVRLVVTPVAVGSVTNSTSVTPYVNGLEDVKKFLITTTRINPIAAGANMKLARYSHLSTLLADGKVLITGGKGSSSATIAKAEIYNPTLETFSFTGDMTSPRYNHTASLLPDGGVLIVGGNTGAMETNSVEIYYSTNGAFQPANSLSQNRSAHTTTLLPDGRAIIAGGVSASTEIEIYNYTNGTFTAGGNMAVTRAGHCAVLLNNGTILFAGGTTANPTSAEVYDPQTQASTLVGNMHVGRTAPRAALLPDGKVLVYEISNAELYDPETQTFSAVMNTAFAQIDGTLTLLNDGRVMISGGGSPVDYLPSVEVYDPTTLSFSKVLDMTRQRDGHSAVVLKDGRVLITGGFVGSVTATSETYVFRTDIDLDGMADDWELANGFDPSNRNDALMDADGDGHTNLQEYLAGTDPHDANSNMRIATIQLASDTFRISFTSVLNKLYRVESASDPLSNSWQTLTNNIRGSGTIMQVTDHNLSGQSRVYRVRLLQ
jgi:uncharacterized repeat protein (TIGR01451 family)